MLTRAYHFLALLLPISIPNCHWLGGTGIPHPVLNGCPADLHADDVTPLGDTTIGALIKALTDKGYSFHWEAGSTTGSGIIRGTQTDPLTHKVTTIALEVGPASASTRYRACAGGTTLISRIEADGHEMSPYEVETTLLTLIDQVRPSQPAQAPRRSQPSSQTTMTTAPKVPVSPAPSDTAGQQPTPDQQAADHAFGPDYKRCLSIGDAAQGIQSALQECIGDEWERRDAELNQVYRAKMASLPPDRRDALRADERAWLKAIDRKCVYTKDDGTLQRFEATYCDARETMRRTQALRDMQP